MAIIHASSSIVAMVSLLLVYTVPQGQPKSGVPTLAKEYEK